MTTPVSISAIGFDGTDWWFTIDPARASVYDPDRLCRVISNSISTTGTQLYGTALSFFVWYKIEVYIDYFWESAEVYLSTGGSTLGMFTLNPKRELISWLEHTGEHLRSGSDLQQNMTS